MKKSIFLLLLSFLLTGCSAPAAPAQIAATTLPVYELTSRICEGTDLTVTRLVTEEVSCLHDYSLSVRQVKAVEAAETLVISGAGLEAFMEDLLHQADPIDASAGIPLLKPKEHHHEGEEEGHHHEDAHEGHIHAEDPHIWLSPANASAMAQNICRGLTEKYPRHQDRFQENLADLQQELDALHTYGHEQLQDLSCREMITFHDGFAYFASAFDLEILRAVEEESGSEASAKELIQLIQEVEYHHLPAIFTEKSGSVSAAGVLSRETGCKSFSLDMAMAGDSYFDAMYHNIHTVKEALG